MANFWKFSSQQANYFSDDRHHDTNTLIYLSTEVTFATIQTWVIFKVRKNNCKSENPKISTCLFLSSKVHRVAPQVPLSENPISPTTSSTSSPKSKSMRHKNSFSSSIKGVFRRRLGSTGKKGDSEKRNSAPPGTIECERDIDHSNIYWFMLYYSYWWHCWWWSFGC